MADIHHMVKAASYNSTIPIDILKFLQNYVSVIKRICKTYYNQYNFDDENNSNEYFTFY